jgi:hypothetical protein
MSSASARDVAHAILGACAAGVRKVLYRPFMINAKPVCSDRSEINRRAKDELHVLRAEVDSALDGSQDSCDQAVACILARQRKAASLIMKPLNVPRRRELHQLRVSLGRGFAIGWRDSVRHWAASLSPCAGLDPKRDRIRRPAVGGWLPPRVSGGSGSLRPAVTTPPGETRPAESTFHHSRGGWPLAER